MFMAFIFVQACMLRMAFDSRVAYLNFIEVTYIRHCKKDPKFLKAIGNSRPS